MIDPDRCTKVCRK